MFKAPIYNAFFKFLQGADGVSGEVGPQGDKVHVELHFTVNVSQEQFINILLKNGCNSHYNTKLY